jgi:hypothetical protein
MPRSKITARMSTGGPAPRKQLATTAVINTLLSKLRRTRAEIHDLQATVSDLQVQEDDLTQQLIRLGYRFPPVEDDFEDSDDETAEEVRPAEADSGDDEVEFICCLPYSADNFSLKRKQERLEARRQKKARESAPEEPQEE